MAVSRTTPHDVHSSVLGRIVGELSRYDLLLGAIPTVFILTVVAATLLAVPFHAAVATAALLSLVLLADGLYVNPPTDVSTDR